MIIGYGDSPDNVKCRKIHPVKGIADPTKHNYVWIPYNYQKHTLEILEYIGMYVPYSETEDFISVGKFSHAYFEPMRHIMQSTICHLQLQIFYCNSIYEK